MSGGHKLEEKSNGGEEISRASEPWYICEEEIQNTRQMHI